MRQGWQFIMDSKGTGPPKLALAALKAAQPLDKIRENECSLNAPSSDGSESAASSSRPQELMAIYAELNRLEAIEQEAETIRPVATLFHWPLGLAFALSLIVALFSSRRSAHA